jgi:hypothetical protein
VLGILNIPEKYRDNIVGYAVEAKWINVDEEYLDRHRQYVSALREFSEEKLYSQTTHKSFISRHAKAIDEWKKLWGIILSKSNFNKKLQDFMREKDIDPVWKITEYEMQNRQSETGNGNGADANETNLSWLKVSPSTNKPTASSLRHYERVWVAEWLFGSLAYPGDTHGNRSREVHPRIQRFIKVLYYHAWSRETKKAKGQRLKLDQEMIRIREIWSSESSIIFGHG